ncbi:MAG: mechanosensitive ion channel domain-containing protein [Bacteroidota bacterium]
MLDWIDINDALSYNFINYENVTVSLYTILSAIVLLVVSKLALRIIKKLVLRRNQKDPGFDLGRALAIYQIFKYVIYIVVILTIIDSAGIKLTILLAGSAALLVGLGLGIQQTFNDFISGIILLFEGTVSVGDIVEVDGIVGRLEKVEIRTSKIITRDNINIIVPNHKLINDNVINWTYNRSESRFRLKVGVAYGSDVKLVKRLLEQAAKEHSQVSDLPAPFARFVDFGESSLDFELFLWSKYMFEIEQIKSDLRFEIDRLFREHKVTIPFPQRDVHVFKDLNS